MCGIAFKAPDLSQRDLALNFLSTLALGFVYKLLKTPFKKKKKHVSYVPYRIVCENEIVYVRSEEQSQNTEYTL